MNLDTLVPLAWKNTKLVCFLGPNSHIAGPKNHPKHHFSLKSVQKSFQGVVNHILMGFHYELGYVGTTGMEKYEIGMRLRPKSLISGPKKGRKHHFSLKTSQKSFQSGVNHI